MGKWLFANGRNASKLEINVYRGNLKQTEMYAKLHGDALLCMFNFIISEENNPYFCQGAGREASKNMGKNKKT